MLEKEVDITRKFKIIENLKTQMLTDIAQLFEELNGSNKNSNIEIGDLLADIIILSYLLSEQLGISYMQIDRRIVNKTKLGVRESKRNDMWHEDLAELLQHFELLE